MVKIPRIVYVIPFFFQSYVFCRFQMPSYAKLATEMILCISVGTSDRRKLAGANAEGAIFSEMSSRKPLTGNRLMK